ncbi:hypothetical protein D3C83_60080 [compost metagenome]
MATAMRKGSALVPSCAAVLIAIGDITAAVAALFMKSESIMVTISTTTSEITASPCVMLPSNCRAIKSAAPVVPITPATGMSAPSRTITVQSTDT